MRIISGSKKGKRIVAPKNLPVRPTTDMAKEALFNILRNEFDLNEVSVVDLFSGTGNLAYEFASRGAQSIRCVEQNRDCVRFINKTAGELGFENEIETVKMDVFKYLGQTTRPSDIVFADPPYELEDTQFAKLVELALNNGHIQEEGMLIVEHSKFTDLSELPHHVQTRKYGHVSFSFFELMEEEE